MENNILKHLLQDYFKDSFNVISYVKKLKRMHSEC